jgi:hypothetical protein
MRTIAYWVWFQLRYCLWTYILPSALSVAAGWGMYLGVGPGHGIVTTALVAPVANQLIGKIFDWRNSR